MQRTAWTEAEISELTALYPHEVTAAIALHLDRSPACVYNRAHSLGLRKTPEFIRDTAAARLTEDHPSRQYRFGKGHVPLNKGLRRPGWAPGRMAQTQFVRGGKPKNWQPIGSERTVDGYLYRKVSDNQAPGMSRFDWKLVHVLVWEAANGPVPPRHVVKFRDSNARNITIENLYLISRAELMKQNTIHRYPTELKQAIRLVKKLGRAIEARSS